MAEPTLQHTLLSPVYHRLSRMRFSTIISALAVATSVTAAPSTSNIQATSGSLSPRTIELNDLAGLVSATVIEDLEQVRSTSKLMQTTRAN